MVETEKRVPKMKGDAIATSEQMKFDTFGNNRLVFDKLDVKIAESQNRELSPTT
jgi:hypothetical protein